MPAGSAASSSCWRSSSKRELTGPRAGEARELETLASEAYLAAWNRDRSVRRLAVFRIRRIVVIMMTLAPVAVVRNRALTYNGAARNGT